MNVESSRSHTIFRFYIGSVPISALKYNESTGKKRLAYLNLVDLAGSEAVNKTKAAGERFKEGTKINQSLLALSNVISALSKNNTSSN